LVERPILSRPPDDPSGATRLRDRPAIQPSYLSTRDGGAGQSEAQWLSLVRRYPDRIALARRVEGGAVFAVLRRLEDGGLVRRERSWYRLTHRGERELEMTRALARLLARTPRR